MKETKESGGCYLWETEWMVLSLATIENTEEQVCGHLLEDYEPVDLILDIILSLKSCWWESLMNIPCK